MRCIILPGLSAAVVQRPPLEGHGKPGVWVNQQLRFAVVGVGTFPFITASIVIKTVLARAIGVLTANELIELPDAPTVEEAPHLGDVEGEVTTRPGWRVGFVRFAPVSIWYDPDMLLWTAWDQNAVLYDAAGTWLSRLISSAIEANLLSLN